MLVFDLLYEQNAQEIFSSSILDYRDLTLNHMLKAVIGNGSPNKFKGSDIKLHGFSSWFLCYETPSKFLWKHFLVFNYWTLKYLVKIVI